jgi:hypothetical protein
MPKSKIDYSYINDNNYRKYIKNLNGYIKDDLTGKEFGEWHVVGYFGDKLWLCRCSCGTYKAMQKYFLTSGKSLSCGHKMRNKLEGTKIGEWSVLKYTGNQHYLCRCSCGEEREVSTYSLTSHKSLSCGHESRYASIKDITNEKFGEWTVIKYAGSKQWLCQCSCGNTRIVDGVSLRLGRSTSCGHATNNFIDLKGKHFGEWEVIDYIDNGYWKCKCSCGAIGRVSGSSLRLGRSTSCGHSANIIDLAEQQFGEWTVLEYVGDMKWKCKCSCGTIKNIYGHALRNGTTKSCGCMSKKLSKMTLLERYMDITPNRIHNPRSMWQINTLENREQMEEYLKKYNTKPTVYQLQTDLDVCKSVILNAIHTYKLENLVDIAPNISNKETELFEYVNSISKYSIIQSDRLILNGQELDIYIPEKKLAIEFNGTYWHSDDMKDKYYHQEKTISCAKQGIHLIHVFEHEWDNDNKRKKICNHIKSCIHDKLEIIYDTDTEVHEISDDSAKSFLDRYSLQNYSYADINLGLFYNNEIISVISFSKFKHNNKYQYEITRYCNKFNIDIVGGLEKLFSYFCDKYNPQSIVICIDISKFTGNEYLKLGFKTTLTPISEPNYVWVSYDRKEVLTKYQVQKTDLIKNWLETENLNEDEIMKKLNFLKIYDSGNLKLEWIGQ